MTKILALALLALPVPALAASPADLVRLRAAAARVTIERDDWGIAHVRGKTDADAVFGAIYAQCEDDFPRVEANYLTALGRTAEAEGQGAIWQDLRQRLFVDPADLQARYWASPPWLQKLMTAWADGVNFYLATHPGVKPKVLTRFEPWMALSFTEGSIGGDIESISLAELARFYGETANLPEDELAARRVREPTGSNGIAIGPKRTRDGHALLLINPHTSFYFRSELQMTSEEGLNAYGASTWGQFFIYQGFNAHAGWMHTTSGVDRTDEFAETIVGEGAARRYRTGSDLRPLASRRVTLSFRTADGTMGTRRFTIWRTHHGPIVAARDGKWIAQAMMWKPVPALEQSWLRTKATDLASYLAVAGRQANSSNDTIFADARGEIAYLHPQFVPVRNARLDYQRAVDGSDPAADWRGLHSLASLPQVLNPKTGWVANTNNAPWTAAGADSPRAADFPPYMDTVGQNARGVHATMLLKDVKDLTPETLMALAYDSYQPAFAVLVPQLVAAYDALDASDPRGAALRAPVALLRGWDYRWGAASQATSLAVLWGEVLWKASASAAATARMQVPDYIAARVGPEAKLAALEATVARMTADFGGWQVPWGEINRFQRLDASIQGRFDDAAPSTPVPFASAQWGSLASFGAKPYPNTKKYYGSGGNSFVAVVEFGPVIRALAVTAGGASGNPASPHFRDQIDRYATGALRPVYFTPAQLKGHVARRYHPGR